MRATRILRNLHITTANPANATGFEMSKFLAATRHKGHDPWVQHEAWRDQGAFTRWSRFKGGFPGLGMGAAAFAGYCVLEHFFLTDEKHHGDDHSHGDGHH